MASNPPVGELTPGPPSDFDPLPFVSGSSYRRERFIRFVVGFNASATVTTARELVDGIVANGALEAADATLTAYLKAQDDTIGNIRTRAAGILGSATIATTLASSFGLIRSSSNAAAPVLPGPAAWVLLGVSAVLVATIVLIQGPLTWAFGAGTDMLGRSEIRGNVLAARVLVMEVGAQRNEKQIRFLSTLLVVSYLLLAGEVVVVLLALLGVFG